MSGSRPVPALPTLEQWRRLYALAVCFRDAEPWRVLEDVHVIGVVDPATNQANYCSVLGNGGMEYGMQVYRGEKGVESLFHMLERKRDPLEIGHELDCVSLGFEPRKRLDTRDLALIKQLGLSFRGAHGWPQFRQWSPGYVPWYLTGADAELLSMCLEQVLAIPLDSGPPPRVRTRGKAGTAMPMLMRVREGETWTSQVRQFTRYVRPPIPAFPFDSASAASVAARRQEPGVVWEVESMVLPTPVSDEEPPYYLRMLVCADAENGLLLEPHIYRRSQGEPLDGCAELLNALLACERRPSCIRIADQFLHAAFGPFAKAAEIPLELVRHLPVIEDFRLHVRAMPGTGQ